MIDASNGGIFNSDPHCIALWYVVTLHFTTRHQTTPTPYHIIKLTTLYFTPDKEIEAHWHGVINGDYLPLHNHFLLFHSLPFPSRPFNFLLSSPLPFPLLFPRPPSSSTYLPLLLNHYPLIITALYLRSVWITLITIATLLCTSFYLL